MNSYMLHYIAYILFTIIIYCILGYGHTTPRTIGGKMFCIVYALLGIPLNIVMFQSIGERFNIGVTFVVHRLKQLFRLRQTEVSQTELTILGGALCLCVLVGGAGAFSYFELWQFYDAFYFCFVTMSTIGFGDYVAMQNENEKPLQTKPEYVIFCIIYILFGLTVFAAALNLMVLKLLTMNTADERKDELEALVAARGTPKVDGDVIQSSINGHIRNYSMQEEIRYNLSSGKRKSLVLSAVQPLLSNANSNSKLKTKNRRNRYTVTPSPSDIGHLLSMQDDAHAQNNNSILIESVLNENEPTVELPKSTSNSEHLLLNSSVRDGSAAKEPFVQQIHHGNDEREASIEFTTASTSYQQRMPSDECGRQDSLPSTYENGTIVRNIKRLSC